MSTLAIALSYIVALILAIGGIVLLWSIRRRPPRTVSSSTADPLIGSRASVRQAEASRLFDRLCVRLVNQYDIETQPLTYWFPHGTPFATPQHMIQIVTRVKPQNVCFVAFYPNDQPRVILTSSQQLPQDIAHALTEVYGAWSHQRLRD